MSLTDELQALILEEALAHIARDDTRKRLADLRKAIEAKRYDLARAKAKQREAEWQARQPRRATRPVQRRPQRACGDTQPRASR